jgi:hypothetical protein
LDYLGHGGSAVILNHKQHGAYLLLIACICAYVGAFVLIWVYLWICANRICESVDFFLNFLGRGGSDVNFCHKHHGAISSHFALMSI